MFGTIRKHKDWLWAIIIVAIVITFVIWGTPLDRKSGGKRGGGGLGEIDGQPITTQQFGEAYRETRLLYFLNFQKWPESDERARQMGFDLDNETLMRLLRLAKVKEEKIHVSDETIAQLAQRILGPKIPLDAFVKEVLQPHGLSEADFERFLRHDAAIQQLGAVAGLMGKLVPPREIEGNYREENEEVQLEGVFLSTSNYMAAVSVTESNLHRFYTNNPMAFRVPEKARVSYVEFHRTNFYGEVDKRLAEITNLQAQYEQVYSKQDPASFKDEDGKVLPKEAAIQKMKDMERNNGAMMLARRKANEFAGQLFDEKDHRAEGLERFAAAKGQPVRVSAPFDQFEGPSDLDVPDAFARAVFANTNRDEAILFQPVEGEQSVYVVAVKERIPPSDPPYDAVKPKVTERYRLSEARTLLNRAGFAFYNKLTNGLAQGQSFAALATESGFKPVSLPPVSRASRDVPGFPAGAPLAQVKNVAFNLEAGKCSYFMPSMEGGFILWMRGKLPFEEAKMKAEIAQYGAGLCNQRQNEAYAMWFRKQAEAAKLPINSPDKPKAGTQPKASARLPAGGTKIPVRPAPAPPAPPAAK